MSKKDTIVITVKGPVGVGKTVLLARIKELILSDTEDYGIETLFQFESESPISPKVNQQHWKETCKVVQLGGEELKPSTSFLASRKIRKIVFRDKAYKNE